MSALPEGWAWADLGDLVVSLRNGLFVSRPAPEPPGTPILRISAVRANSVDVSDVRYAPPRVDRAEAFFVDNGDLLFTRYSGNPRYVGACGVVRGLREPTLHPDKLIRAVVDRRLAEPAFVALAVNTGASRTAIEARLKTTAGQVGIAGGQLRTVPVPVAPVAEQRRIVQAIEEHFSRLDNAEDSLRKAKQKALQLRRQALAAAVPKTARWVPTRELAEVQGGIQKQPKRRPTKNHAPFLRVANVGRNRLDLSEVHEVELFDGELNRYRLEVGDLLVVEGNGSPDQIGRSAVWKGEIANCVHQNHLIRVRPGPDLDPDYLALFWNAPQTADRLRSVASSTSGLYTLSTAKVKSIPLPVLPLEYQRQIVAGIERDLSVIDALVTAIDHSLSRSEHFRASIVRQAFAGRLVPSNPSDEPASELLARILGERSDRPKPRLRQRA